MSLEENFSDSPDIETGPKFSIAKDETFESPGKVKSNLIMERGNLRVEYFANEESSIDEISREIISSTIEPLQEMEEEGIIDGLGITLGGSFLNELSKANDIDINCYFKSSHLPDISDEDLSNPAYHRYSKYFKMLKYLEETKENGIGIGIGIKASSGSKVIRGFPKFVDFGLASQKGIVRDYENEDKSSWRNLIPRMVPHINSMAREMMSLDGSLYSDTDRLNASYTVLLLCKAYLGEYPESVLDEIGLFNKPESSLEYIGAKNPEYIDDLLESYSEIIEIDGLKDSLRMLVKGKLPADKLREVFLKLADSYLGGYSYLEKPHQTLRLIVNGETYMRRFSQTASLIYGDNIVHNSKPLFKENKDYLLEKKS